MFRRAKKNLDPPRDSRTSLLERSVARFFHKLPPDEFPNDSQLRAAVNDTEIFLQETLCSEVHLATLDPQAEDLASRRGFISLEFTAWLSDHPLPLPAPTFSERLNGWKLAFATMLGALLGGLLFSGAFNFFSDDPRTGYTVGSLLGAGAMVLAMWYASENKKVRRFLQGFLGVASAAEVVLIFGKLTGLGALWSALSGNLAGSGILRGIKRIFLYILIIFILRLSVRRPIFEHAAYQKNLRILLNIWLDQAEHFLGHLLREPSQPHRKQAETGAEIPKLLGSSLHKLHQTPRQFLPEAAAEILLVAQNLGLEGLDGEPVFISGKEAPPQQFVWEKSYQSQYNVLGVIEEGDPVFVESKPVIQEGRVIEKGNVRKIRRRS